MTSKKYKYECPQEWLLDKARRLAAENDMVELLSLISSVVDMLDADTIQDVFQSEMEDDGYFDEVEE